MLRGEIHANFQLVTAFGEVKVVLDLIGFDDATLRKDVGRTVSGKRGIGESDAGDGFTDVGLERNGADGVTAELHVGVAVTETKFVDLRAGKGVGPLAEDVVGERRNVDGITDGANTERIEEVLFLEEVATVDRVL